MALKVRIIIDNKFPQSRNFSIWFDKAFDWEKEKEIFINDRINFLNLSFWNSLFSQSEIHNLINNRTNRENEPFGLQSTA